LLARALEARLGPSGMAERLLAACGSEVISSVGTILASAEPAARARLAAVMAEASHVDLALVRRLVSDADPEVRRAAQSAQARLAGRPPAAVSLVTLGGFSVRRAGAEVPLLAAGRGGRARALLALLVATQAPVHREALLEWLWPHLPPGRGLASLQTTVHTLRQALEPEAHVPRLVVTAGETYRLVLSERDEWDAGRLMRMAEAARAAASPVAALGPLLAAERADTGPFLPEWPYEEWAAPRRAEIERVCREVLERLAETLLALGEPQAAAARYERLIAADPERESSHRGLMRAYALAGERGLALRQYHACRTLLRERLGVDPSAETRSLYLSLL
jgi:DNA-binding SARP family transcriptional activator